jgi:hypothetical protein
MSTLLIGHSKSGSSKSSRILFEPYEEEEDDVDDDDEEVGAGVDEGESPQGTKISWGSISGTSSMQKPSVCSIVPYVLAAMLLISSS